MPLLTHWEDLGFHAAPRRVVSLVPSVTESIFEIGCGEQLLGITDYCVHPAAAVRHVPKIGGTKNPDLQRIKAILPDLIIANQEENGQVAIESLAAEGFRIWLTFPRTVRHALDLLHDLVQLFHVPQMDQGLSALETAYEWASLAAESAQPVKVFCPIWREPAHAWWMTFNRDTYIHDLLRICGAENVFADRDRRYPLATDLAAPEPNLAPSDSSPANGMPDPGIGGSEASLDERDTRYPRVTLAEVAARAPELILLPSEPYDFTARDLAAFDEYPDLPAVKNNNLKFVDGSLLTWHGIRLAQALSELPALINATLVDGE
jgi:ABC-type Fe3+-hydroxamate transport system substrate-binding protein